MEGAPQSAREGESGSDLALSSSSLLAAVQTQAGGL